MFFAGNLGTWSDTQITVSYCFLYIPLFRVFWQIFNQIQNLSQSKLHMKTAKELARTCYEMYNTRSGMGPEIVHFKMNPSNGSVDDELFIKDADAHSLLRPEAVEAWFYLFRYCLFIVFCLYMHEILAVHHHHVIFDSIFRVFYLQLNR